MAIDLWGLIILIETAFCYAYGGAYGDLLLVRYGGELMLEGACEELGFLSLMWKRGWMIYDIL